jgi:hypothetical protein
MVGLEATIHVAPLIVQGAAMGLVALVIWLL